MKNDDEQKDFISETKNSLLNILLLPIFLIFDIIKTIFILICTFLPYIIPVGLIVLGYFIVKLFI